MIPGSGHHAMACARAPWKTLNLCQKPSHTWGSSRGKCQGKSAAFSIFGRAALVIPGSGHHAVACARAPWKTPNSLPKALAYLGQQQGGMSGEICSISCFWKSRPRDNRIRASRRGLRSSTLEDSESLPKALAHLGQQLVVTHNIPDLEYRSD